MSNYIQTYQQYLSVKPISFRNKLRNQYLNFKSNTTINESSLPDNGILFILFHNMFLDKKESFKSVLKEIQKYYTFIPYSQAVNKLNSGNINGRFACISADDGFKDFLEASDLFDSLGIKSMVFVNPIVINETDHNTITLHCKKRLDSPPFEFLTWDDLENLKSRGHEVGNHGWGHLKLTKLDDNQLEDEVNLSKDIIEKRIGATEHYAYTYGKKEFINQKSMDVIFKAGHKSICSAIRGQHLKNIDVNKELIKREQIESWYTRNQANYFIERSKK